MNTDFNSLPWHDATLLSISIDRSDPGHIDTVSLAVHWPNGSKNNVVFQDCYMLNARMNFGVVAAESILKGEHLDDDPEITAIKNRWEPLGVPLHNLSCYRIVTNSTNSQIHIYSLSYALTA